MTKSDIEQLAKKLMTIKQNNALLEEEEKDLMIASKMLYKLNNLIDYIYDAEEYAMDDEKCFFNQFKEYGDKYKMGRVMGLNDITSFIEHEIIYDDEVVIPQ